MSSNRYHAGNPIRRHGDTPRDQFTLIPNELARDNSLSMHAYRVAIVIRTHADGYEVSAASLAKSLGWGRGRTGEALRELVQAGWLVIRPYRTVGGKRAFDEYHIHTARRFTPDESATLAEPVTLGSPVPNEHTPLSPTETPPCLEPGHPPVLSGDTKEDHLEDHLEEKLEDQAAQPVSPLSMPDTIKRTPIEHDSPDEYLPDDCSNCYWNKRPCGKVRELALASVGATEPNWSAYRQSWTDAEPPWN